MNDEITIPGWYADPDSPDMQRWWDGQAWTELYESPYEEPEPAQPQPLATADASTSSNEVSHWGTAGGLALVILGSLLPWATVVTIFGSVSVSGTEGDGLITLLLGVIGLVSAWRAIVGKVQEASIGVIAAGLALLIAVYHMINVSEMIQEGAAGPTVRIQIGIGLWLIALGSLFAIIAGLSSKRN